jgi:hypothetical protein
LQLHVTRHGIEAKKTKPKAHLAAQMAAEIAANPLTYVPAKDADQP